MPSKLFLSAVLLTGAASPILAQTTITPFVGTMIPMRSMLLDTAGSSGFRMQAQRIEIDNGAEVTARAQHPAADVETPADVGELLRQGEKFGCHRV